MSEASAVGEVVVTLTPTDVDDDDGVSLSIVDGDKQLFTLDSNQIKLATTLDFESAQCHSLVIK